MNNQPDYNQPRFGEFGSTAPAPMAGPERLSLMALFSTITGAVTVIGCCIPAVGLVPLLLAIGGFIGISRSRGAVRGKGLAIVGGVLGIVSLLISSVLWIGASSGASRLGPVYAQAFDPDPAVVRTVLSSSASADLTDEQVAAFQAALAAEGVTSPQIPGGLLALLSGYGSAQNDMQGLENLRDPSEGVLIPLPAETASGWVVLVILADPEQPLGSGLPGVIDACLWTSDGRAIWLFGTDQSPAPGQTDTGTDTPAADAPVEDPDG